MALRPLSQVSCVVCIVLLPVLVQAQQPTGTITGVVRDPSGAIVPGASITIVDRKSTRLNSSHQIISYAVFCLKNPPTPEFYTLSLHDALPIFLVLIRGLVSHGVTPPFASVLRCLHCLAARSGASSAAHGDNHRRGEGPFGSNRSRSQHYHRRSEEHTSELQSPDHLVCRLLLEKSPNPRVLHSFPTRRSSDLLSSHSGVS